MMKFWIIFEKISTGLRAARSNAYIIAILCFALFGSCTTTKYVTKERTDTLTVNRIDTVQAFKYVNRIDTFFQDRAYYVTLDTNGNVKKEKEVINTRQISIRNDSAAYYKAKYDSLYQTRKDYSTTVQEKPLSLMDSLRIKLFGFVAGLAVLGWICFGFQVYLYRHGI